MAVRWPAGCAMADAITGTIHAFLSFGAFNHPTMGMVSLASALIGAQTGEMQLAVAARLAHMDNADNGQSIAKLVNAADQNANSLANVAANIGTNLDVSA